MKHRNISCLIHTQGAHITTTTRQHRRNRPSIDPSPSFIIIFFSFVTPSFSAFRYILPLLRFTFPLPFPVTVSGIIFQLFGNLFPLLYSFFRLFFSFHVVISSSFSFIPEVGFTTPIPRLLVSRNQAI